MSRHAKLDLAKANTSLSTTIRDNKVDRARQFVLEGANVNWLNKEGVTPLIFAAEKGYLQMCTMLLDNGAHVHALDGKAFRRACSQSNKDVVALLCERGDMTAYAGLELMRMASVNATPLPGLVKLIVDLRLRSATDRYLRIKELEFFAELDEENAKARKGSQIELKIKESAERLADKRKEFEPDTAAKLCSAPLMRALEGGDTAMGRRGENDEDRVPNDKLGDPKVVGPQTLRLVTEGIRDRGKTSCLEYSLYKNKRLHTACIAGFVADIIEIYTVAVNAWEHLKKRKKNGNHKHMRPEVQRHLLCLKPIIYESLGILLALLVPPAT